MMANILVTGGAGYIGSHVCKALHLAGFTPVCFDNLSRGHAHAVRWGPLHVGDVLDGAALDAVFQTYQPAAVLHFAALTNVQESSAQPLDYYRVNVGGTLGLLAAMHRAGCTNLIFSSTCATYSPQAVQPIDEGQPQSPINPYGRSKLFVEQMLADADRAHGVRSIILRYFNAAGADPDGEIGEEHEPEPHLLPLALLTAAGHRPMLDIFGDDYPTPDGTCIRDYVHVSDLADAHILALRRLLAGATSDHYNLGNNRGISVRQLVEMVRQVTGRPVPVRISPRRLGDPPILVADADKARHHLGWIPQRSALAEQVGDAWRWIKHRHPPSSDSQGGITEGGLTEPSFRKSVQHPPL